MGVDDGIHDLVNLADRQALALRNRAARAG